MLDKAYGGPRVYDLKNPPSPVFQDPRKSISRNQSISCLILYAFFTLGLTLMLPTAHYDKCISLKRQKIVFLPSTPPPVCPSLSFSLSFAFSFFLLSLNKKKKKSLFPLVKCVSDLNSGYTLASLGELRIIFLSRPHSGPVKSLSLDWVQAPIIYKVLDNYNVPFIIWALIIHIKEYFKCIFSS